MANNRKTGFVSVSSEFDTITSEDFEKKNSGYIVAYKQVLAQCRTLQSQLDDARTELTTKDNALVNLKVSNGIYSCTTWINVLGAVLSTIGTAGAGLAFRAPLPDKWKCRVFVFSLVLSITGSILPIVVRIIASKAANKNEQLLEKV